METSAGWERTKRIVDLVSGLSVIATMVFIALQWNEMHTGATDTHDLALAAKSQADAAKSQADNTKTIAEAAKSQAENTKNLALASADQVNKLAAGVRESHALVKAAQNTLLEMRGNFTKDQRPYMWPLLEKPTFEEGKQIRWGIFFNNYGRSPAIRVRTCVMFVYGTMDARPNLTTENLAKYCKLSSNQTPDAESVSVVPPGANSYVTEITRDAYSGEVLRYLKSTDFRLGMMGTVRYEDMLGNSYSTTFCDINLAAGGIELCSGNNEIK